MVNKSKIEILVSNITWVYIGKIFIQVFSFIVSVMVIRKLSVQEFGTYTFLLSSFFIVQVFVMNPISSVLQRYIPELTENKNHKKVIIMIFYSIFISLFAFLVLLYLIYLFKTLFAAFFNIDNIDAHFLSLLYVINTKYFATIILTFMTSLLLHKYLAVFRIAQSVISPVIYLYYLPILDTDLMLLIFGSLTFIISIPSVVVIYHYFYRKMKEGNILIKESSKLRKRIFRYGFISFFNEIGAGIMQHTTGRFILAALGDQYLVGLYSFSYRIKNLTNKILPLSDFKTIIRPLFIQKFTGSNSSNNREELIEMYNFIVKIMFPVFLFPSLYFFLFGRSFIINIYGVKYIDAYLVAVIALLGNLNIGFFYPLRMFIELWEKNEISLYNKVVSIFCLIGAIFSMKHYGIIGLVSIMVIGDLLKRIVSIWLLNKTFTIKYNFSELKNYLLISIFLSGLFYYVDSLINNILTLAIFSILFMIFTIISIIFFHPFNNKDLKLLNKICNSSKIFRKVKSIVLYIFDYKNKVCFD